MAGDKKKDGAEGRGEGWTREGAASGAAAKGAAMRPPPPASKKERPASKGRVHKGRTRA